MKSEFFSVRLHGEQPPDWALGEQNLQSWYFENVHREQWVAKRERDILRISGLDIGWKEIVLTVEQAVAELNRLKEYTFINSIRMMPQLDEVKKQIADSYMKTAAAVDRSIKLPLAEWIFNDAEVYWLISVLDAAIPLMEYSREKK